MSKKDITTRSDLEKVVDVFYEKIKVDEMLQHMFINVKWQKHLPVMYDFWENVLFHTGNFNGNPMEKHQVAHQLKAMEKSHFDQWVLLFNETINELYTGENAEKLKDRAKNIAVIMQMKILGIDKDEFEGK